MNPIKRGTAQKLGLRKPPRRYKYSRDRIEPDPSRRWWGVTVAEATVGIEQFRRLLPDETIQARGKR